MNDAVSLDGHAGDRYAEPPDTLIPSQRSIISVPLPGLDRSDRILARGMALLARRRVRAVHGAEHIGPGNDPFILVLNHSTRMEALLVPAMLVMLRRGRRIHFLADWNFRLIPFVGLLYRRSGVITVMRKPARPRFLNILKPLVAPAVPAADEARSLLLDGSSVGVFPEGTVNRDPSRLLKGSLGAARLSLETGAKIVPAGLRFPRIPAGARVSESSAIEIHIGAPLVPQRAGAERASHASVKAWHRQMMAEIGRLSGKSPAPHAKEIEPCASLGDCLPAA